MTPEAWLLLAGQLGTVALILWKFGRAEGSSIAAVAHLAESIRDQAAAIDRLADGVALESKSNAAQDATLKSHDHRITRLEDR